jgi:methionine-R-sulfoxide reductase
MSDVYWRSIVFLLAGCAWQPATAAGSAGAGVAGPDGGGFAGPPAADKRGLAKPSDAELRERLTPLQYQVTQQNGTEWPYRNEYWDKHDPGLYTDIVTGEPLFISVDKYDSHTGWPSFIRPLAGDHVYERPDHSYGLVRREIRSRSGDSHLGHIFEDGPPPTGLRYCVNSAALRFVPLGELEAQGYGGYRTRFDAIRVATAAPGTSAPVANGPLPAIVRGTIASIDAKSVSIVRVDGTTVTVSLAPGASFSIVEPRSYEQIKATDFVGITSVTTPDGTLHAEEVHIIPWKGYHEGSYPWDHSPGGSGPAAAPAPLMTNGTVAVAPGEPPVMHTMTNASVTVATMTNANVTASSGVELKVAYHGSMMVDGKCIGHAEQPGGKPCTGVATVEVSPGTPIVAIVPAKATDAKAGLAVFAAEAADAQGKTVVTSLVVEKNGVKPPF